MLHTEKQPFEFKPELMPESSPELEPELAFAKFSNN
jgi:hypothetical protein